MSNTHTTLASLFGDIADAIRAKTGNSADIVADDFPSAIAAIPSGGTPESLSECSRLVSKFVPELTFSSLTATEYVEFVKPNNVKYYVVMTEAIYYGSGQYSETPAGYGFQLLDSNLNVIDSGKNNRVNAISTAVRVGSTIRTTVTVLKASASGGPDGIRLITSVYALK